MQSHVLNRYVQADEQGFVVCDDLQHVIKLVNSCSYIPYLFLSFARFISVMFVFETEQFVKYDLKSKLQKYESVYCKSQHRK